MLQISIQDFSVEKFYEKEYNFSMRLFKINGQVIQFRKRRYGLSKVSQELEKLMLKHFFLEWRSLTEQKRKLFVKEIEHVIQKNLLGKELLRAIVHDMIAGEIRIDSALLQFLKTRWYKGDLRKLLADFQTVREDEEAEIRREKFGRLRKDELSKGS